MSAVRAARNLALRPGAGEGSPGWALGWALGWIVVAVVLALLQVIVLLGVLPQNHFPLPTQMIVTLGDQIGTASFWSDIGYTLRGWASGMGIAVALAIPLGVLFGSNWVMFHASRPIVEFLRPVPSVALIPLAILLFGTGLETKLVLVAYAAVWPLLLQTLYGIRDVDPVVVDTARSFGLSRWQRATRITLPSAIPYVMTGVRISSSIALILAIVVELLVGAPGVGSTIGAARSGGNVELMYAMIIVSGVLGWTLNSVIQAIESRVLHWHPSQREANAT